jgi:hypothetical protein
MWRALSSIAFVACWSGSPAPASRVTPREPSRAVALAIEHARPGRLVVERNGRAWEVTCDGRTLAKRPWEGGAAQSIGACDYEDPIERDGEDYIYGLHAIAIGGAVTAVVTEKPHEIVVARDNREVRRYAITGELDIVALAIDGDAVLAVAVARGQTSASIGGVSLAQSLAAIVRLAPAQQTSVELVRYGSTGASVTPTFVAAGTDHLLLVSTTGSTITCDYRLRCGVPLLTGAGGDLYRAVALRDGGMIVMEFDHAVTRLDAAGRVVWTKTGVSALALVGATADHVWVVHRHETDLRFIGAPVTAFALGDGKRTTVAVEHGAERDPFGRYLVIRGVATTPAGTVVRGVFGGVLTAGHARLETEIRGAVCWWETPHSGDEHPIDLAGTCQPPHAKAIETARRPFVAIGADALASPPAHD